jgi:hypothetical protein
LKNVLEPKLKEIDCEDLFWNVEMPLSGFSNVLLASCFPIRHQQPEAH